MSRMCRDCTQQMRTTRKILVWKIKRGLLKVHGRMIFKCIVKEYSLRLWIRFYLLKTLPVVGCWSRTSCYMECGEVLEEMTDYFSPKQNSYLREYIMLEFWLSESNITHCWLNSLVCYHFFLPDIISCLAICHLGYVSCYRNDRGKQILRRCHLINTLRNTFKCLFFDTANVSC
jgi:hypothetical protein